jgi:imidazolonepropionase
MDPALPIPYGALGDRAIGVREGRIAAIEPMAKVPLDRLTGAVIDAGGAWITPGLIDCHTHLCYGSLSCMEASFSIRDGGHSANAPAGLAPT